MQNLLDSTNPIIIAELNVLGNFWKFQSLSESGEIKIRKIKMSDFGKCADKIKTINISFRYLYRILEFKFDYILYDASHKVIQDSEVQNVFGYLERLIYLIIKYGPRTLDYVMGYELFSLFDDDVLQQITFTEQQDYPIDDQTAIIVEYSRDT